MWSASRSQSCVGRGLVAIIGIVARPKKRPEAFRTPPPAGSTWQATQDMVHFRSESAGSTQLFGPRWQLSQARPSRAE